jgi:hypothetical protein
MTYFDGEGHGYTEKGEPIVAVDAADYPLEWTSDERLAAYWFAHTRGFIPRTEDNWRNVLANAKRTAERHHAARAKGSTDAQD